MNQQMLSLIMYTRIKSKLISCSDLDNYLSCKGGFTMHQYGMMNECFGTGGLFMPRE